MSRLRVLIFIEGAHCTSPESPSARYWGDALELLPRAGVDYVLCTLRDEGWLHQHARELGQDAVALKCTSTRQLLAAHRTVRELVHARQIQLIHASESIQAATAFFGQRRPFPIRVFHRHHFQVRGQHPSLSRAARRFSQFTMAVSHSVAEHVVSEGVPRDRVLVAHNGIPSPRSVSRAERDQVRLTLAIGKNDVLIGVVGNLRPEKGHSVLMPALPLVASMIRRRVHLLVVGDGPESRSLREMSTQREFVHFVGHQDDVAKWYAASDVVVIPSLSEPFGLVAVEGLACHRPIVASRTGGLKEIIRHRESGLLFEPGDVSGLAEALGEVLTSPQLAAGLSREGFATYQNHFTSKHMVERWVMCYRACIAA